MVVGIGECRMMGDLHALRVLLVSEAEPVQTPQRAR